MLSKRLILLASLIAVSALLAALLMLLGRPDEAVSSVEAAYLINAGTVSSITVQNEHGTWTVLPESASIAGFENCTFNSTSLSSLLYSITHLISQSVVVENTADLSPFALNPPRATLSIQGEDSEALYIGSDAPDGKNVYTLLSGGALHLVSKEALAYFLKGPLDFVDTRITGAAPESELLFTELELGGTARGYTIKISAQDRPSDARGLKPNPYQITSPVNAPLFMGSANTVIQSMFSLRASKVVSYLGGGNAALALEQYGLAEPYSTLTMQDAFTLYASKPDDYGTVYVRREGVDVIYETSAQSLPWLEASFFSLMDKFIIMPYIGDIYSVEIASPSLHVIFYLEGEDDLSVSMEQLLPVQSAALSVDTAKFRIFYQTLLLAQYNEEIPDDVSIEYEGRPLLEIIYRYKDGVGIDRVSFYPTGAGLTDRRVMASLNRGRPFYTYSTYIDSVRSGLNF